MPRVSRRRFLYMLGGCGTATLIGAAVLPGRYRSVRDAISCADTRRRTVYGGKDRAGIGDQRVADGAARGLPGG